MLGEARDAEVLSGYFDRSMGGLPADMVLGPAKARITVYYAPQEAAARDAVIKALDSGRYAAMFDELGQLLASPPGTPAGPRRHAALHEARKAARRTRYAAEAVTPAFGGKARRLAKRMKAVQSVLGDHHDAVVARAAARDIGVKAHMAGENAFSFGLLHERAHRDALGCEEQAWHAWKRARRSKTISWLGL